MSILARRAVLRRLELHLETIEGIRLALDQLIQPQRDFSRSPEATRPNVTEPDDLPLCGRPGLGPCSIQEPNTEGGWTSSLRNDMAMLNDDQPGLSEPYRLFHAGAIAKFHAYFSTLRHIHAVLKNNLYEKDQACQRQLDARWDLVCAKPRVARCKWTTVEFDWPSEEAVVSPTLTGLSHMCSPEDMIWEDMVQAEAEACCLGYSYRKDKDGRRLLHL